MPFCREDRGAGSLGSYTGDLEERMRGPHACELRELDLARDIAHRLRTELIYGMPAEAQIYDERDVPTSRNLPMFMGSSSRSSPERKIPDRCSSSGQA